MKISANLIEKIAIEAQNSYQNSYIENISLVSPCDFLFIFSKNRKEKLFVSLFNNDPAISFIEETASVPTIENKDNEWLRKEVRDSYVSDIHSIKNDRILEIDLVHVDDLFNKEERHLIIELIPLKSNIILVNSDYQVIKAIHYRDELTSHPIVVNQKYDFPQNSVVPDRDDDLEEYLKEGISRYNAALSRRHKSIYSPLYNYVKSRIKTDEKTKKLMEERINDKESSLRYKDLADLILTYQSETEELNKIIEENKDLYDSLLSPIENANKLYKKYHKLQNEQFVFASEIERLNAELESYQNIINLFPYYTNEEYIDIASQLHFQIKGVRKDVKKRRPLFYYVEYNGVKIAFGKNSAQNNYLTFKFAQKNYTFVHIAGYSGSHVIVCSSELNDDLLKEAASISIVLSGQESGSVHYCQVKDTKKGDREGLVIMKSYKKYHVNKIKEETKLLLNNMKPYIKS
ncbi:MAG: NFACT family protein [Coprobacillus sp.]|nr:NFACT family protein [Coprobacillus sp.]